MTTDHPELAGRIAVVESCFTMTQSDSPVTQAAGRALYGLQPIIEILTSNEVLLREQAGADYSEACNVAYGGLVVAFGMLAGGMLVGNLAPDALHKLEAGDTEAAFMAAWFDQIERAQRKGKH